MNPTNFDRLVRSFARPTSRRRTVGVLAGATLAALGPVTPSVADTTCKPNGTTNRSKCNHNAQCCSRVCVSGRCGCATPPSNSTCSGLRPPRGGICSVITTTEGCRVCTDLPSCGQPERYPPCTSTADCAANAVCAVGGCSVCADICGLA
jgi:hypothetical protein